MIYTTHYNSPVGNILLAEQNSRLIGLWIEGQKYFPHLTAEEITEQETPLLSQVQEWLNRFFSGAHPKIDELALSPSGSEFRQEVWKILRAIPYGEVITYGKIAAEIAARTGKCKMSAQAIGGAVGHNPISIIIPCHRVVGASGSLTGYAGGIAAKVKLLTHEGVDISGLSIRKKSTVL